MAGEQRFSMPGSYVVENRCSEKGVFRDLSGVASQKVVGEWQQARKVLLEPVRRQSILVKPG